MQNSGQKLRFVPTCTWIWAASLLFFLAPSPARAGAEPPRLLLDAQGHVRSWLVLGPFRAERPDTGGPRIRQDPLVERGDCFGFDHDLLAGAGEETGVRPAVGDEVPHTPGMLEDRALSWRAVEPSGWYLDFNDALGADDTSANLVAYAGTYIHSSKGRPVRLQVNSDDSVKLWLNGKLLHDHFVRRGLKEGTDELEANLAEGSNFLLAKVHQAVGGWALAIRILTASGVAVVDAGWREFMPPVDQKVSAEILVGHGQATARLAQVQETAAAADLTGNPYVDCGLYVAQRYLDRIDSGRDRQKWRLQQLREINYVLSQTQALIGDITAGKAPPLAVPRPTGGPVTARDGQFLTQVSVPGGEPYVSPYYFYGYGHWGEVRRDLPNFRRLGATLIQQSKSPVWAMRQDGTYTGGTLTGELQCALPLAQQHKMKVDMLLELHGFPDWAMKANPEMRIKGGFIKFNVDHPVARNVCQTFIEGLMADIRDKPALFSVCLSNEPSYRASGRDEHSRPRYLAFLQEQHGTIAKLNELYDTDYGGFDAVQAPDPGRDPETKAVGFRRALYDWADFNRKNFLDWHQWLHGLVKKAAPNVPTHTKTIWMVLDQENAREGYDPGRMSSITDLAGLDLAAYYYYDNDPAAAAQRFYSSEDAFGWSGQTMGNDFHHSIKGAPVFNSEHHIIHARSHTNDPVPPQHTRAVLWHGALHHMGACTIWVWHEPVPGHDALQGSIYIRPANVYAASRTMFDLNRLARQVSTVSGQPPRVALLYSYTSAYWDDQYPTDMMDAYVALTFLGEPVGFVTRRQLAAGTFRDYDFIVVPGVSAVRQSTVAGLEAYMKRGTKVILYGDKCLAKDRYWRNHPNSAVVEGADRIARQKNRRRLAAELNGVLTRGGLSRIALTDARTGAPAWGVDYRVVPRHGSPTLVSALNVLKEPVQVALDLPGRAVDLVTGAQVDLKRIQLDPMEFVLLEIQEDPAPTPAASP